MPIYKILDEFWFVAAMAQPHKWPITFDHVSFTFECLGDSFFDCRLVCFVESERAVQIFRYATCERCSKKLVNLTHSLSKS
jgi:hypothetical protein